MTSWVETKQTMKTKYVPISREQLQMMDRSQAQSTYNNELYLPVMKTKYILKPLLHSNAQIPSPLSQISAGEKMILKLPQSVQSSQMTPMIADFLHAIPPPTNHNCIIGCQTIRKQQNLQSLHELSQRRENYTKR